MRLVVIFSIIFLTSLSYASDYMAQFNRIKEDVGEFRFSAEKDQMIAGISVTTISFFFEGDIKNFFEKNRNKESNSISDFGNWVGNPFIDFAVPMTIYTFSEKDSKLSRSSFSAGESVFFSTLIAGVSSLAIGRNRPYKETGRHNYKPFSFDDNDSFPSKHLASSTALFTTYAKYYDAPVFYLFPLFTAFGRLYENKHYLADTAMGATIGYIIADYVYKKDKERQNKLSFLPVLDVNKDHVFLGFTYKF
ncbi:MAG: phosphatase PAP2 family protein [Proteobacteria bacterium]|nr:phosphatase PAP2 family protein [Pseudomonadota bacterium]